MRARKPIRFILLGLTVATLAGALTFFGVLRDFRTTHALMPLPIQPFAADAQGGISTNQLGVSIAFNYTITQVLQGERTTIPGIFSGPGFSVDPDSGPPYDVSPPPPPVPIKPLGTVWSSVDVFCDGQVDLMYDGIAQTPLTWLEATTDKNNLGPAAFLLPIMPPWPWIARHKVDIGMFCIGTVPPWPLVATNSVLNTVYAQIPFSPGGGAFVAATKLGGSPTTPPSSVCLDSPQTSESITNLYNNPSLAGNSAGGPVGAAGRALDNNSGLYARWTILQSQGSSSLAKSGDLRKDYKSPPSLPSDTGYVERIIDLQCFWIDDNGCGPESVDQCLNANDDDGDTVVNDGCPAVNIPETVALGQCADSADAGEDSPADGVANDGCPVAGPTCDGSDVSAYGGPSTNPPDGIISELESWNDPDLNYAVGAGGIGGINNADLDRDCLMASGTTQPGWPVAAVDTDDVPNGVLCKTQPNWVVYSAYPADPNPDTSADSDCDGLLDGIEWAYGSNRLLPDTDNDGSPDFVEMFMFTDPTDTDTDDDGFLDKPCTTYLNDGTGRENDTTETLRPADPSMDNCPSVANADQLNTDGGRRDNGTIVRLGASNPNQDKLGDACDDDDDNDGAVSGFETAQCDNNINDDSTDDGVVNDGCPAKGAAETTCGETACADNGSLPWDNCDDDGDTVINDGCPKVGVTIEGTDPLKLDSDGDSMIDGVEYRSADNGGNPYDPTIQSTWGNPEQVYYRGCQINVAEDSTHSYTEWDAEYDGIEDDVENNPDGDAYVNDGCAQVGTIKETGDQCLNATDDDTTDTTETSLGRKVNDGCPQVGATKEIGGQCSNALDDDGDGVCPSDPDSDNGGLGHVARSEFPDRLEAYYYGTSITNADTDGDTCADWIEITDLNGDRMTNSGDTGMMNRRVALKILPSQPADKIFDLNKDGIINAGDQGMMNKNTCLYKYWGGCPICPPEY